MSTTTSSAVGKSFSSSKRKVLIRSAGVSNFKIEHLEQIRQAGLELPVINQILLHPYVYKQTAELLAYHAKHHIVTEAYSSLIPITQRPGGPLETPLTALAARYEVPAAEIIFAWVRAKKGVVVTSVLRSLLHFVVKLTRRHSTSRSKERLESYLHAGEVQLSESDVKTLDDAGASSYWLHQVKKRVVPMALCAGAFVALEYFRLQYNN